MTMAHRFFFFAGGDYNGGQGNTFTSNFIRYLAEVIGHRFSVIEGIYHHRPVMNVIWALNRAQEPLKAPLQNQIIASSVNQILTCPQTHGSKLTLVSSSYGSVVAAQTACHLAEVHLEEKRLTHPFNLALGASMVHEQSGLLRKLEYYQQQGVIDKILLSELHDDGDNSNGLGGRTRFEAYSNGLGICFPILSRKFSGPSFLNNDPVHGHLHRVRAQSIQKAKDFIQTILIDHELGGKENKAKAELLLEKELTD
jgi:hypothetical protein